MGKLYLYGRGGEGTLEFSEEPKKYPMGFELKFSKRVVRKELIKYLITKRDFSIPESNQLDDYRIDHVKPVSHITYFWLALCELGSRYDVNFYENQKDLSLYSKL